MAAQYPPSFIQKRTSGGWKTTLSLLLKEHGKYSADSHKVISFATLQARRESLYKIFNDVRELGFKLNDVKNLKGKHIVKLSQYYSDSLKVKTLSIATVKNRFSHLRTFSKWIKKPGLVKPIECYIKDIEFSLKRTTIAKSSNAWIDKRIDPQEKIEHIRQEDNQIADALLLQLLFGLRTKESLLMRPHLADKGAVLIVSHGTKGGRDRFIPIETDEQRLLLDKIKSYVPLNECLVHKNVSYESFRRKYYRVLKKYGVCRNEGITAHGLRHQHLNALYEKATGSKSPVQGGNLNSTNKELDSFGRKLVSERAGHSRESIASAYIGGKIKLPKEE